MAEGAGCCGALSITWASRDSHGSAAANIRAWIARDGWGRAGRHRHQHQRLRHHGEGLRAHVPQRSAGRTRPRCPGWRKDVTEVLVDLLTMRRSKCRAVHGAAPAGGLSRGLFAAAWPADQGAHPKTLLKRAGFEVVEPADSHLCCGSAGTYNLMQPEISKQLGPQGRTLEAKQPRSVAAGNIGCMMQIGGGTDVPIVHTVELLDWATGGPKPAALEASRL